MRILILFSLTFLSIRSYAGAVEDFFAEEETKVYTCRYDSECSENKTCKGYFPPISLGETTTREFLGHCEETKSTTKQNEDLVSE